MEELRGKTALVTGASAGLGADFARLLGRHGANLVLVARRRDRLEALKKEIAAKCEVDIEIIALDLLEEGAAKKLFAATRKPPVDILINNAGFGVFGDFQDQKWARILAMINLDLVVLAELSHLFGRAMVKRSSGHILLVASLTSYQAMPRFAAYAAVKAAVLSLGEALHLELKPKGVNCTVLSPGVTDTEFQQVAEQKHNSYTRSIAMKSEDVALIGLKAMLARKMSVVSGASNKFVVFINRFAPRWLVAKIAGRLTASRKP